MPSWQIQGLIDYHKATSEQESRGLKSRGSLCNRDCGMDCHKCPVLVQDDRIRQIVREENRR